jgi:DNA mismatch repair protein MutS2
MVCPADQLRPAGEVGATQRPPSVETVAAPEVPVELDLVGQRVEPALELLDRYIDRALLVPYQEVRVVHGHGTGRLRQGVREFLAGHAAVAGLRPGRSEEGGEGVTIVRLAS